MADEVSLPLDGVLAGVLREGEAVMEEDFAVFYRSHVRQVYAFLRCHASDASTAEDLTSRVFVKAYAARDRAPQGADRSVWLFRIAHTTLIDHWRAERRRPSVAVDVEELDEWPSGERDPEATFLVRERQAELMAAVAGMDEREQMLITLRFAAERTNREIAAILNISERAVSMRLLRALRRLRAQLRERGVS